MLYIFNANVLSSQAIIASWRFNVSLKQKIRAIKYNIRGFRKKWNFEYPVRLIRNVIVDKNVSIGKYTYIVSGRIYADTRIGRYCSIAENAIIGPSDHPIDWLSTSPLCYGGIFSLKNKFIKYHKNEKPTVIGNDVWLGANVFIKRGVEIGDGAIIAAGSVVVKDVPPYAIVGGNPAKIIRYRFENEIVLLLLDLKWWALDEDMLKELQYDDILSCISKIQTRKNIG